MHGLRRRVPPERQLSGQYRGVGRSARPRLPILPGSASAELRNSTRAVRDASEGARPLFPGYENRRESVGRRRRRLGGVLWPRSISTSFAASLASCASFIVVLDLHGNAREGFGRRGIAPGSEFQAILNPS